MNWNTYVARRNVNVEQWLESRDVKSRESFVRALLSLSIEPPDDEQLASMFPSATLKVEEGVSYESAGIASERSDQAPSRSMVGEGDRTGERANGKRSTKVRG